MESISFHELANIFPMMQGKEFADLKVDIKANGLREAIWLYDGKILDGRNRFKACQEIGVTPEFREYVGSNPTNFVISLNLHRRHLNESQRSMVAAKLANMEVGGDGSNQHGKSNSANLQNTSRAEAAEMLNVSERSVNTAKKVEIDGAKELIDSVESGAVSVSAAADIAELPKDEQVEIVAKGEKEILQKAKAIRAEKAEARKQKQIEKELERKAEYKNDSLFNLTICQDVVTCDAVITDPPYGILDEDWEPDDLEFFTREWLERWNESSAQVFIVSWSQRHLFDARAWFDESLTNYYFQQLLIWHYPNNKSPQSRKGFKYTFEPIFFYRKHDSDFEVAIGAGEWGDGLNDFDCHVSAMPQSNFNDQNRKQHPAQKSVDVMRWLVNAVTAPGQLVADPFAGSGTTGLACKQLGRSFHGIEINSEYLDIAKGRIAAYG